MLRRAAPFLAALVVCGIAAPAASAATALYPDLQTLPPRDLRFDYTDTGTGTNHTVLRFTNTAWNAGEGDLAIGGNVPLGTTSAPAIQTVKSDDGSTQKYSVGNYTIHPEHQHFHYDGWGKYELWTKASYDQWIADNRPANREPDLIGTKTTSCVLDEEFISTLPNTPYPRRYTDLGCDPTRSEKIDSGLAPGWGDTYDFYRFEQWIDLGATTKVLDDGTYVLRSVADPDNKIYESPNKADGTREGQQANEAVTTFKVQNGKIADSDRPSGTLTLNNIDKSTPSTNVTARLLGRDDVSGVTSVRLSNDGANWSPEYSYGGSGSSPMAVQWNLADSRYGGTSAAGLHTVYAQFKDASGKWSATVPDTIELSSGTGNPPPPGSNSAYRTAVLEANPVVYYRLGEASGTTAFDEKQTLLGTYTSSPVLGAASLLNSDVNPAVKLAGSAHVRMPDSDQLILTGAISLEAWIRPDQLPAAGQFASVVTRPEGYTLQFNGPKLEFTIIQDSIRRRLQAPVGTIEAGKTYHVVGTYDGASHRLYVNGQLVASSNLTGPAARGFGLNIGSWDGSEEFFQGTVDEVAVYDTLLTGLQAKQHYDAGIATTVGVSAPTNLAATAASSSRVDLTWTDTSANETGFRLERSTDANFTSPTTINVGANIAQWSDQGLTPGQQYWYRVKAVTATDSSAYSNTASATTTAEAVAAPTNLKATAASSSRIDVAWTDASNNETGFVVERSTSSAFTNATTLNAGPGSTTLADTGLTASTTYYYRAKAVNGTTSSAWSATASATTQASTTPPPAGDYAKEVTDDGPVSFWRLGESSGTTANDARNLNKGTYTNGPVLGDPGLISGTNTAVRFDGANDHVRVPNSASLQLTSAMTLEAWVKPSALPATNSWASLLTKPESYSLQFAGPLMEFTVIQSGNRRRLRAPSGAIAAGSRYHVVGTYDGATQRLYVNGVQVASRAQTGPAQINTQPLEIASWDGLSEYLKGTVDEVAVYNKVLSSARVAAHYNAGK